MVTSKRMFTDAMPGRIEGGLEKAGVAVLHGETRFTRRDTVAVNGETFSAQPFHIATGARPMPLDILGEELLTTSTDFLALPSGRKRRGSSASGSFRRDSHTSPSGLGRVGVTCGWKSHREG